MSFSPRSRFLQSCNTYKPKAHPRMSAHEEQSTAISEPTIAEWTSGSGTEFSPQLIEERIRANLDPLHAPFPALTHLMDRLIQDNLAGTYPTISTRDCQFPSKSPFTVEPRTSRTLSLALLVTAGYLLEMVAGASQISHKRPPNPPEPVDTDVFTTKTERQTTNRHPM